VILSSFRHPTSFRHATSFPQTIVLAVAVLSIASGCAPSVPRLGSPARVDAYCGSKQARNTGIASVLSSTDDVLLDDRPTQTDVDRAVRSGDGVLAYYNEQLLSLPRVAAQLGETDGYARVAEAAIPPAPDGASVRHIYLDVSDHGHRRWIMLAAYDVQNVCVEGKRDA
jgi:hypothetical protein